MVLVKGKGKGLPQQAEVAQGVLGRLRSRIFLTISTTRVVGRQPYGMVFPHKMLLRYLYQLHRLIIVISSV